LAVLAAASGVAVLKSSNPALGSGGSVNFAERVAPIIFNNCTTCHRPGEAAPFALMHYADVKKRGKLIAAVTASRQMPPWKADKGDYEFKRERRLTDAQIETIKQWVADDEGEMPQLQNAIRQHVREALMDRRGLRNPRRPANQGDVRR